MCCIIFVSHAHRYHGQDIQFNPPLAAVDCEDNYVIILCSHTFASDCHKWDILLTSAEHRIPEFTKSSTPV